MGYATRVNGDQFIQDFQNEMCLLSQQVITLVHSAWESRPGDAASDQEDMTPEETSAINDLLNSRLQETSAAMQGQVQARLDFLQAQDRQDFLDEQGAWEEWHRDLTTEQEHYRRLTERLPQFIAGLQSFLETLPDDRLAEVAAPHGEYLSNRKENLGIIAKMFAVLPEYYRVREPFFQVVPPSLIESPDLGPIPDIAALPEELPKYPEIVTPWLNVARSYLCRFVRNAAEKYHEQREHNYRCLVWIEEQATKLRDVNLDFLKKSLLPPIDGIERGRNHPVAWHDAPELDPALCELLRKSSSIYEELDLQVLDFLKCLEVFRLEAHRGEAFDLDHHNPVYLEETEELEPGAVLEMARSGYAFRGELLRPIDVILTRASKERAHDA